MLRTLLKIFGLLLALGTTAQAQDYPTRPVRLIIPFAPGGSVDIVARLIAAKVGDQLGQQVTPDNRAGAGGIIGAELAAKAPADGYTLLLVSLAHTVNPHIYKVGYDTQRSFSLVAMLGNGPSALTVHPSVPANSVKELIALAKADPNGLQYASSGAGTMSHLSGVLLASSAGINGMISSCMFSRAPIESSRERAWRPPTWGSSSTAPRPPPTRCWSARSPRSV